VARHVLAKRRLLRRSETKRFPNARDDGEELMNRAQKLTMVADLFTQHSDDAALARTIR